MKKDKLITRMKKSIANRRGEIVLRSDFNGFASPSAVTAALQILLKEGVLLRIGYGVYAKTEKSVFTGEPIPREPLETLAVQFFRRKNIPFRLGFYQREYAEGRTTQIPVTTAFDVGKKRLSRTLTVGARTVLYESS